MIKFFCASNDRQMLCQNIINNPHVNRHPIEIEYDHNRDRGLPERYNAFIERNLNSGAWLVFIHDDVELLEDLEQKLKGIPKDIIYGLCGAKKSNGKGEIAGQIWAQDPRIRNGQKFQLGRRVDGFEIVPTFDPLCIIIHSGILRWAQNHNRTGWPSQLIRFDENLGYHLFSEELNIRAKKDHGIETAVLQVDCCHYSWGTKTKEYFKALEYIKEKHGIQRFIGTCDHQCMDNSEEDGWE